LKLGAAMLLDRENRNAFLVWQRDIRARPEVARALSFAQYALLALVIVYLIYKFSQVGWGDVMGALPVSIWFYVFFALRFLALPISEMLIYEVIWGVRLRSELAAFLRKRVYNFAVVGYSGEGFLTLWARRKLDLDDKTIVVGVKDNNLLSALASNIATVVMVLALLASGTMAMGLEALPGGGILFLLAFLSSLILSITVISLRRRLISLPASKLKVVISVHAARTVLILILHAAMYAAALPGAPLVSWVMFLALQLVLSRIPFIPNQDLVFLGAALSLAPLVNASEAALAGMLLAEAGLSQVINLILFFATAHVARLKGAPPASVPVDGDS